VRSLDSSNFPKLDSFHVFTSLKKEVKNILPFYPQTYCRAECAMQFCWLILGNKEQLFTDDLTKQNRIRESYLRASLAEFVSMEDTIKRETNSKNPIKLNNSSNPLLHILRELRNLEIHLTSSTLSYRTENVIWGEGEIQQALEIKIWSINNLKPEDFLELNNAKHYDKQELIKAADIFLKLQSKWGINEMIFQGINLFCEEIIDCYGLRA
jgi:hypothetical protein